MSIDGVEDGLGELMAFEQVPKVQQSSSIRGRFPAQVDADKSANSLAVVEGVLNPFIREPKTLLGDVHPQHSPQSNRRTPPTATARVERGDRSLQIHPRRDRVDLGQETIPSRLLLLGRVFQFRKTRLHPNCPQ